MAGPLSTLPGELRAAPVPWPPCTMLLSLLHGLGLIMLVATVAGDCAITPNTNGEVIIPDSWTSIGASAFRGCYTLRSVQIPNSVISIGIEAFRGCSRLTSVQIPDSVTLIDNYVFHECSLLRSVQIPNSVTSIGISAFRSCTSLTSVQIPDSVTSIGHRAFYECSSLTSVQIPDSVTSIGHSAFYSCIGLDSVRISGDSMTSIGPQAFRGCSSLTSVQIPDLVTSIGNSVFYWCTSLDFVRIPHSVTSIGSLAFRGCSSLTSVQIPDSVTSIGSCAFCLCPCSFSSYQAGATLINCVPSTWFLPGALTVVSGASYCTVSANGCVSDGAGNYGNGEQCTIRVNFDGRLTATSFNTQTHHDRITIGEAVYSGSQTGPQGVAVSAGSTFSWVSDTSVTGPGWVICYGPPAPMGEPTRSPSACSHGCALAPTALTTPLPPTSPQPTRFPTAGPTGAPTRALTTAPPTTALPITAVSPPTTESTSSRATTLSPTTAATSTPVITTPTDGTTSSFPTTASTSSRATTLSSTTAATSTPVTTTPTDGQTNSSPTTSPPSPTTSGPIATTGSPTAETTPDTTASPPSPVCPRNCGASSNGGGTCRTNGRCLSCNANKVLQSGRCYSAIACKGRRIQSGSQVGSTCRCLDDHCHYCNRHAEGDTCRVCRDGWYLLEDACVQSCPATLASSGIGQFKRRCAEPFTCQSGRLMVDPAVNYGCKCATEDNSAIADCQICEHRAGEHGEHCTKCNAGKHLFNNRCQDSCDGTGLISYAPGNYGRECRAPFTCTNRVDEAGNACKCARSVGRNDCAVCFYHHHGITCARCTNSKVLSNGACVEACPYGTNAVGAGREGRECQ